MNLFISDIKNIVWLREALQDSIPGRNLLELPKGFYIVFNYNLKEDTSDIDIKSTKRLFEINDSVYLNMNAAHVGYFKEPFETSNYLFYSFLKYCLLDARPEQPQYVEQLVSLFLNYKQRDIEQSKNNLRENIRGFQVVNSDIDFRKAIGNIFYMNQKPITGITMVYELINKYFLRIKGKQLYGNYLTAIAKSVPNPNGGLIPEYSNSTMRYLIIGEKGAGDDPSLKRAKFLLRGGSDVKAIFYETGWFFNKYDFKWRKRISDDSFAFKILSEQLLIKEGFYITNPSAWSNKDDESIDKEGEFLQSGGHLGKLAANGYDVKVSDVIVFEEAFKYYPSLRDVLIYINISTSGLPYLGEQVYYFNPSIPKSFVFIGKKENYTDLKYTALHEIQHFIQDYEGFASGGNEVLANIIDSVGGGFVRDFFNAISNFNKRAEEVFPFMETASFHTLIDKLMPVKVSGGEIRKKFFSLNAQRYYAEMIKSLSEFTKSKESASENAENIAYVLMATYSIFDETQMIIADFVKEHMGEEYIDCIKQSMLKTKETIKREASLMNKGWSARDLYMLNFQLYEALAGEMESRFVQQTTRIPEELKNYFEFYTSETVDPNKIRVISERFIANDGKKYKAAIETFDGKYVMHLPDELGNSINILHETGHILYDTVSEKVLSDTEFMNRCLSDGYSDLEEYFCDSFVDYVHRKNIDNELTLDLTKRRNISQYNAFDEIFENMLFGKSNIDESLMIKMIGFVDELIA